MNDLRTARRLLIALSLALCSVQSARALEWTPVTQTVALGQTLELSARLSDSATTPSVGALQAQWADAVHIEQSRISVRNGQRWLQLQLLPLRVGTLQLALPDSAQTLTLEVTRGGANVPAVWIERRLTALDSAAHVGQPMHLQLSVCHAGQLHWTPPATPRGPGQASLLVAQDTAPALRDGVPCSLRRWDWLLIPSRSGVQTLPALPLRAQHFGESLKFQAPALRLEVQSLPGYLPGGIALQAPLIDWRLQATAQGPQVQLDLRGNYAPGRLQALIESQLAADGAWQLQQAPQASFDPQGKLHWQLILQGRPALLRRRPPLLQFPWYDLSNGDLRHLTLQLPAVAGGHFWSRLLPEQVAEQKLTPPGKR